MNLTYLEVDHNRAGYDSLSGEARSAFMERLVLSWMYHDHALEGVVLSHADMMRALSGQPVRNYCDGLVQKSLTRMRAIAAHLFECAQRNEDITMEFVKDLHVRLCDEGDESAGRYRKRDTSPGVYNLNIVPNGSISYYFRKFLDTCNEDLKHAHPIRAAAIAHHEFMKLFPFDEKSGIVGRLLMNYMLIRAGYPPAIIHQMDRHHYFSALDGHPTDLVPVIVDALSATLAAADEFARQVPVVKREVAYAE
jgi:Fic family protein